jgi:hypothetical protein
MRSRFLRYTLVAPVLLFLLMFTAGTAGATSVSRTTINPRVGVVAHHYIPKTIHVGNMKISTKGTHYLYVDDGTQPDSIDAYSVGTSLTHIANYPTNGYEFTAYYGASTIAVATADSAHGNCLIYGSATSNSTGFMTSFPINSDGTLGTQTSEVATATGAIPGDVVVKGDYALDSNPASDIESYSIGSGCVLTFSHSISTSSVFNIGLATAGKYIVSADTNGSDIDTYMLGSNGSITSVGTANGSVVNVDGVATHKTNSGKWNVYTGQATASAPEAQAGHYSKSSGAITFFSGSPATDSQGANGAAVTFYEGFLIMGEGYTYSLGNFKASHGSLSFSSHVSMAVSGSEPSTFLIHGSTLFVDGVFNGDIEGCALSSTNGASNCQTVATLSNNTGVSSGLALL